MMLIQTTVQMSAHGLGLFTAVAIAKGDCVWRWDATTEIVLPAYDSARNMAFESFLDTYGYHAKDIGLVVNLDNARFMNHSNDPNLEEVDGANYALRDIAPGEELTCDYRVFDAGLSRCGRFLKQDPTP